MEKHEKLWEKAESSSTTENELRGLSKSKDWTVRFRVPGNPNCPLDCFEELSRDKKTDVRCAVAEHAKSPEILARLLKNDSDWLVRAKAAENPNTPIGALKEVARREKEHSSVLYAIARNPLIAKHKEMLIIKSLMKTKDVLVRIGLSENANTPEKYLRQLFDMDIKEKKITILRALASNTSIPQDIIAKLSENKDLMVRLNILTNPSTQKEVLEKLLNDKSQFISQKAAEKLGIPTLQKRDI